MQSKRSAMTCDFQIRHDIAVHASVFNNLPYKDWRAIFRDNNGNEILSELRHAAYK